MINLLPQCICSLSKSADILSPNRWYLDEIPAATVLQTSNERISTVGIFWWAVNFVSNSKDKTDYLYFFFFFFPSLTITGCFSRQFFLLLSLFLLFLSSLFYISFSFFPFFQFCKYISLIFFFLVVFFASFTFLQFSDFHFPNTFLSPLLSSLIYHIILN